MIEHTEEPMVTLDELAGMIAEGFTSMQKRMDEFEHRIEALEQRIDALEQKMEAEFRVVHKRIDMLFELHEDHSRRIKNLELAAR